MKKQILIAAITFVIAHPAVAQTAPVSAHQNHQQHSQDHAQHGQGHAQHGQQSGQQGQGQHQGHDMQGGCCADANGNGRMDCCENMSEGQSCCPDRQQSEPRQAPAPQGQPRR